MLNDLRENKWTFKVKISAVNRHDLFTWRATSNYNDSSVNPIMSRLEFENILSPVEEL